MLDRTECIERILENLRRGLPEYAAAEQGGASYPTYFNWKKSDPGFAERIKAAKLARIPLIEDALYKIALKGSVTACLAILEKEDKDWRDRAKDLAPQQTVFNFNGKSAVMIGMLTPEKRQKLVSGLVTAGLLPQGVIDIAAAQDPQDKSKTNGNGSHGANGNGAHHGPDV